MIYMTPASNYQNAKDSIDVTSRGQFHKYTRFVRSSHGLWNFNEVIIGYGIKFNIMEVKA